jgi:hypothetical protein
METSGRTCVGSVSDEELPAVFGVEMYGFHGGVVYAGDSFAP